MSFRYFFPRFKPVFLAHKLFEAAKGSNKKTPIVFIHGLLERMENWGDVPQRVADLTRRKVYAYDARNHGASELTMNCSFDYAAYDLYHFLNQVNVYKAILVGKDLGGTTACIAALQNSHLIEGIFVLDMHAGKLSQERIEHLLIFMKTAATRLHDVPDGSQRPNLALVHIPPPKEELEKPGMERIKRSVLTYQLLALMDALMQYDKNPLLPADGFGVFHGPAYFLYGSKTNNRIEENTDNIKQLFPKAEILRFEGYSPHLKEEHPDLLVNTIVERLPRSKIFGLF